MIKKLYLSENVRFEVLIAALVKKCISQNSFLLGGVLVVRQ